MDIVFDMATIFVIGFTVVLALGALLRKDPRLSPQMFFGLVGLLVVAGALQLVPEQAIANGGDAAADGSAGLTNGAVPTEPTPAPVGTEADTTSPPPPLTVTDFLASDNQPTAASVLVPKDRPNSRIVQKVCGPPTVWTFDLAKKYATVEVTAQLTGTADAVPTVTFQAEADGRNVGMVDLRTVGDSKRLQLDVANMQKLVLKTSATKAAECPKLLAEWDFQVTPG